MSVREKYAQLPALPPDIMQRLKQALEVLKRHSVRLAYLFGSAAKEIDRCTDVDIAVLPGEGFSYRHLYADLSLVLNTDRLDLIDLRFAPAYLLSEVLKGKCLFALSEEERARFEGGQRSRWREERCWWIRKLGEERSMNLQRDFVAKALAELEQVARELEKYRDTTAEMLATNLSLRWTVERGLLVGLGLIFQIADHILARAFQRSADTYEGLLLGLKAVGVISDALYRRLKGSGGFRNVLVHEYMEVDLEEVASVLRDAPYAFRTFRDEVLIWLRNFSEKG